MIEANKAEVVLIGYSGHSYVVIDTLYKSSHCILGYCDTTEKVKNPFDLKYLGQESENTLSNQNWFVGIGDNKLREKIILQYKTVGTLITVVHPTAYIGSLVKIGVGTLLAANSTVNPLATISNGCIINTGAIVEHECFVSDYSHVAPGAVLAGNVTIGKRSFIGANSVIKQGVNIGNDVTIGAGSVVLNDVPDNYTMIGNPARKLFRN